MLGEELKVTTTKVDVLASAWTLTNRLCEFFNPNLDATKLTDQEIMQLIDLRARLTRVLMRVGQKCPVCNGEKKSPTCHECAGHGTRSHTVMDKLTSI